MSEFACVAAVAARAYPHPGSGMLTRLPFGEDGALAGAICAFQGELSLPLGSTNPCPIDGHMEPCSTSVFKDLV